MKRLQINMPIFIIAQIGWWTALFLSYNQFKIGKFCAPLFAIPTCYIILILFTLIIISIFVKNLANKLLFYIPALIGLLIAFWFSAQQATDPTPFIMHCPQLWGFPLCYASLAVFSILLILKRKEKGR
ncbi:MAG: hypothetical protein ABIG10_01815 [bacterium]